MAKKEKKSEYLQVRVDPDLKKAAESVFEKLGLSTSQAIKLFLAQVRMNNGLPFDMTVNEPQVRYFADDYVETLNEEDERAVIEALEEYERGEFTPLILEKPGDLLKYLNRKDV